MDNRVAWAFAQPDLNAGEKLVLVWLALRAGAGAALMQRDQLAAATDYEPRSLQRILKTLRDRGILHESGDWYSIGQTPGNEAPAFPPAELAQVTLADAAAPIAGLVKTLQREGLISDDELEVAGETLSRHITEAADGFLNRFTDQSLRLLQGIEKIAQAARVWEQSVADAVAPEPPPDPVRDSAHYKVFLQSGFMSEDEAYALAKRRIEAETDPAAGPSGGPTPQQIERRRIQAARTPAPAAGGNASPAAPHYPDTTVGRFERVRDILDPTGAAPWSDSMTIWTRLEEAENKHTVEGETDAFELLYPAIVVAARQAAGRLTLAQFLDEKAIKLNQAPWDKAPRAAKTDQELEHEIAVMLNELERANHPMCQVSGRTKEEGTGLIESTAQFHARVKRVHQQLKQLQDMGV